MHTTITSIKDERITLARALNSRKGRARHHRMLLEGARSLDWAIQHGIQIEYLLVAADAENAGKYAAQGIEVYRVSEGIQKKVTGTRYLVPLVGVGVMPPQEAGREQQDFVVVLDDIQDFGNLGTIVRTCQAFGVHRFISPSPDFDLFQRKTIEASRGTVFSAAVQEYQNDEDTIRALKNAGCQLVVTSPRGRELQSLVRLDRRPVALVLGNESRGVSAAFEAQADVCIQIPMAGAVESLNVGVAAGISIYELRIKQIMAMIEKSIKSPLGRELNVAGMLVQQALDAELTKVCPYSSQQVIFMMVLKCDRQMSVADMRRQFGVLEDEVEVFLAPLTADGLVLQDGTLTLSEKGEELLGKLWFTVEAAERKIMAGISLVDAARLMQQLRQIQDKCVEIVGERNANLSTIGHNI